MSEPTRLPAGVKGLAAVSLFNDLASEMVYPLLPAFVTTTLGGSPAMLGAIDGASECTASAIRWWSGRVADRPKTRGPLVLAGYAIAALARPVMAVTAAAWQVVAVRVVDRVGKGLRSPPRDAMIADLVPSAMLGRAFGLHRSADHLGAVLGSLLGFELLRRGFSVRQVLGLSWIPGVVAVLVLGAALAAARWRSGPDVSRSDNSAPVVLDEPTPNAGLWWLAGLAALRLPETLLLLRLQQLGAPVAAIPLVWALLHVVRSAASYPSGMVADRLGVRPALLTGTVLYALLIVALGLVKSPGVAVVLFLLHGIVAGMVEPAERAAVAGLAPIRRGSAFGRYQALVGIGALVGGVGFGWMYQTWTAPTALPVAAVIGLVPLAGWLAAQRRVPG